MSVSLNDGIKPEINPVDSGIVKSKGRGGKRPGAGRKRKANNLVASNPDLNLRQKRYIQARVEGSSKVDAAAAAGYSRGTNPYHIENAPSVREAFKQLLGLRLSDEKLAQRLAEGLDATEIRFFQKDGIVTDQREVIDWKERRAYAGLACDIKEVHPQENDHDINLRIQTFINSVPPEWQSRYYVSISQERSDELAREGTNPIVTIDSDEPEGDCE